MKKQGKKKAGDARVRQRKGCAHKERSAVSVRSKVRGEAAGNAKTRGAKNAKTCARSEVVECPRSRVAMTAKPVANEFWKVCAALDNEVRIDLLRYLLTEKGQTGRECPCVIEIADHFYHRRTIGLSVVSQYLKKLREAGLVNCQRSDKRIYYRAFAATDEGRKLNAAFRGFFETHPSRERIASLVEYLHALSHERRNAIVRHLAAHPHDRIEGISRSTEMPKTTALRLFSQLAHVRLISVDHTILQPTTEPEATLLALTLK